MSRIIGLSSAYDKLTNIFLSHETTRMDGKKRKKKKEPNPRAETTL
jgi:small nuclear ribonucleoprotein (snRNP)-like protein